MEIYPIARSGCSLYLGLGDQHLYHQLFNHGISTTSDNFEEWADQSVSL